MYRLTWWLAVAAALMDRADAPAASVLLMSCQVAGPTWQLPGRAGAAPPGPAPISTASSTSAASTWDSHDWCTSVRSVIPCTVRLPGEGAC